MIRIAGTLAAAFACMATGVNAEDLGPVSAAARNLGISEVRGGPALTNLELFNDFAVVPEPYSLNVAKLNGAQFDVLFRSPDLDVFRWLGSPRPSIGTVINFSGHESVLHAGLDWHLPLGSSAFYLEGGIGLGIHNGYLNNAPPPFHNTGCRTLFHWQYGAGVNLSEHVTLTAEWQHVSSIGVCSPNQGINDLGITVGWKF